MYWEIEDASGGGYFARARGDNHEKMFHSEVYVQKASARHAIDVVKAEAASAPVKDNTSGY